MYGSVFRVTYYINHYFTNMDTAWVNRWNDRYSQEPFAYGEEPNLFLKEQLEKLPIGSILFPAEGEGRNAVFAATLGWKVSAFDISSEGKKKALRLAENHHVAIDYQVGELAAQTYSLEQFDALALIYAHFPGDIKSDLHKTLVTFVKKGGIVIFEAFSKQHLDYVTKNENVGGPRDLPSLFSLDEIKADFAHFEILQLEEVVIELHEGLYHNGTGSVIRFVGRKK